MRNSFSLSFSKALQAVMKRFSNLRSLLREVCQETFPLGVRRAWINDLSNFTYIGSKTQVCGLLLMSLAIR